MRLPAGVALGVLGRLMGLVEEERKGVVVSGAILGESVNARAVSMEGTGMKEGIGTGVVEFEVVVLKVCVA